MSNMSYCRFQNTSGDLQDCINAVEAMQWDGYDLSHEENKAFARLLEQAATLISLVGDACGLDIETAIQYCGDKPDNLAEQFMGTCLCVEDEDADDDDSDEDAA